MDNRCETFGSALNDAITRLGENEIFVDSNSELFDPYNLLDIAHEEEIETDDYTYFCVGALGNIGLTKDKGFSVQWLYKPVPANPITRARRHLGLTKKQLSKLSGVNVRQIKRFESGESKLGNVSSANLAAIAKALDTTVEAMLRNDTF